jgi:hypothetical protein
MVEQPRAVADAIIAWTRRLRELLVRGRRAGEPGRALKFNLSSPGADLTKM